VNNLAACVARLFTRSRKAAALLEGETSNRAQSCTYQSNNANRPGKANSRGRKHNNEGELCLLIPQPCMQCLLPNHVEC
jgi:hypothetical protein